MTGRIAKRRGAIAAATAIATSGFLLHNLMEFSLSFLIRPETLGPLGVTVLLLIIVCLRPGRATLATLTVWIGMHLFLGGPSVLPLPGLPFVPEQTLAHYVAHVFYAGAQLPMVLLGWQLLHNARPKGNDATMRPESRDVTTPPC